MKSSRIKSYIVIFVLLATTGVYLVKANTMNDDTKNKLISLISEFGKQNNLTGSELESLLGEIVLKNKSFAKGGIGIINKNIYIDLKSKGNEIIISEKRWKGNSTRSTEVVVLNDKGNIYQEEKIDNTERLILIIFRIDSVQFVDLHNNIAGEYKRETN